MQVFKYEHGRLHPGQPLGMYHWEADQEDFLVLAGEAILLVEGQERPLRQWDFVHCPPRTNHMIIGAGDGPCTVLAIGGREHQTGDWGAYTVSEAALRTLDDEVGELTAVPRDPACMDRPTSRPSCDRAGAISS